MKMNQIMSARIQIVHPDPASVIKKLTNKGYILRNVEKINEIKTVMFVAPNEYKEICKLLETWLVDYAVIDKNNFYVSQKKIIKRIVLIIVILVITVLTFVLQGTVLFVEVSGNNVVPTRFILDTADQCGIHLGAKIANVRSEKIKNAVLQYIPELEWVGVNTRGCVATIFVRERDQNNNDDGLNFIVSSLVASVEGVVHKCSVNKGTLLCQEGQNVQNGQVLISGFTDCGVVLKATKAEGEVYASTLRSASGLIPLNFSEQAKPQNVVRRFGLRIGKKLINFDNNSGIYGGSCDKILIEKKLILPGDFELPISVVIEEITVYDELQTIKWNNAEHVLFHCTEQYLDSQMVAGTIENEQIDIRKAEDSFVLNGSYLCTEMIGRRQNEDIFTRGN